MEAGVLLAHLHVSWWVEVFLHDAPTCWSPRHMTGKLTTKVLMGSKGHWLNIMSMCESTLLLLAMPATLQFCSRRRSKLRMRINGQGQKKVMVDSTKVGTGSTDEMFATMSKPLVNGQIVTGMLGYP